MENNKKAEELAMEIYPYRKQTPHNVTNISRAAFMNGFESRQSHIDDLKRDIEDKNNVIEFSISFHKEFENRYFNCKKENDELTKEVKTLTSLVIDYINQINDFKKEVERLKAENERVIKLSSDNKLMCYLRDKGLFKEEHDNVDLKGIYMQYLGDEEYHNEKSKK